LLLLDPSLWGLPCLGRGALGGHPLLSLCLDVGRGGRLVMCRGGGLRLGLWLQNLRLSGETRLGL
jgi:hypothetical protein